MSATGIDAPGLYTNLALVALACLAVAVPTIAFLWSVTRAIENDGAASAQRVDEFSEALQKRFRRYRLVRRPQLRSWRKELTSRQRGIDRTHPERGGFVRITNFKNRPSPDPRSDIKRSLGI